MKCTQIEECDEGDVRQGESQMDVILVNPEMNCVPNGDIAIVGQIHPGTSRGKLGRRMTQVADGLSPKNGCCIAAKTTPDAEPVLPQRSTSKM